MIIFILCNVVLALLVKTQNPYLPLLTSPFALGIGLTALTASLVAGYWKKIASLIWHDYFATAVLLVWFAYWKPQFNDEAPMFFFFPLYFALLTTIVTLTLINKSPYFDAESVQQLRHMEKISRFDFRIIVAFVLISLVITRHYALFPMAMTFFIIRHSVIVCLETVEKGY